MAHYAFLNEHNVVFQVIAGRDENDLPEGVESWEDYYGQVRGSVCKQTSYNTQGNVHLLDGTPFRKNYAGIGFTYDEARDAFIPPTPYPSWVLDEDTCLWVAPGPMPEDGVYVWDEQAGDWVAADG